MTSSNSSSSAIGSPSISTVNNSSTTSAGTVNSSYNNSVIMARATKPETKKAVQESSDKDVIISTKVRNRLNKKLMKTLNKLGMPIEQISNKVISNTESISSHNGKQV